MKLNANQWYHVCVVFDRSDKVFIYIYGVLAVSVDITSENSNANHSDDAMIGRNNYSDTYYDFMGYICNVGYWNAALTQPQVKSIMHKGYAALSASEKTDLVSWWSLDSTIPDVSTEVYDNHHTGSDELGSELITNGSFDGGGASWNEHLGWTIAGGVGSWDIATADQNHHISQTITALVVGEVYKLTFTISNNTTGRQNVRLQGSDADPNSFQDVFTGGYTLYANGEHAIYFKATGERTDFRFAGRDDTGGTAGNFSVDDISLKLVNGNIGTLA